MASPILTHVIGYTAMMAILFMVISFVSSDIAWLRTSLASRIYGDIARSIALQIRMGLELHSNTTYILEYPIEAIAYEEYSIAIGNGSILKQRYDFLKYQQLNDSTIYVLVLSFDKIYHEIEAIETTNNVIIKYYNFTGPEFGSRALINIMITFYNDHIELGIVFNGVKRV